MKKILALVLALSLCLTMTAAMAEAVDSKTTANLVYTNSTEIIVAPAAPTEKAVLDIVTAAASAPVVTLLDTKVQEAVAAKLPATVDAKTLKIDECFTLAATATTVAGEQKLTVTSAVKYDTKANVVVLAYVNGEWVVLDTEIVDGELVVTLPDDVVAQMATGAELTTMILSDAQ